MLTALGSTEVAKLLEPSLILTGCQIALLLNLAFANIALIKGRDVDM